MISAIAMSVLLVVSLSCFTWLMTPRMKLLWAAKPEQRFDQIPERLKGTLKFAIGQWRMAREPIAGAAHIMIFSGFMVLTLATITHIAHAYDHDFYLPGLGGLGGKVYGVIKDIFEFLVLVGVSYGLWRRLKRTPSRVGRSWEGVFVLCMITVLMLTDFFYDAGNLVASGEMSSAWNPGGSLFAVLISGFSPDSAHIFAVTNYWIHCITVLVFLNFLPIGKHFHVITGIPKVFFRDLNPYGQMEKIDLEKAESFGIKTTADLSWSQVLDLYSCTECGRCTVYCPTVLTHKPLTHRQLNLDLKHALYDEQAILLSTERNQENKLPDLVGGRISADTIWACTTCGSCEQECPVFIENVPRIIQMRQNKVLMDGDMPPELTRAFKGMEQNSNPWGIGSDKRDAWAEGLEIPRVADIFEKGDEIPLLYWIGCAGSFDDRNKKITLAVVRILKAAGVPFAILGKEEGCSGDPARRTGNEYLFQALAESNVEILNNYKIKRIMAHCPHCLHTLKTDYPQFGGNYEVLHHTQVIEELVQSGKLQIENEIRTQVAYHDSCYLGRYHNIYESPRNIIKALPGAELVELERNKSRSVCCGAGGGRFWLEENIGERINIHRSQEALAAKTDTIGSACPFCLTMLKDGVAALGHENVQTLDIAEIVARALGPINATQIAPS